MKKKFLTLVATMFSIGAMAQVPESSYTTATAQRPDTVEITTIDDIIREQQENATRNSTTRHYAQVWGRRSYFNISFCNSALNPKEDIATGIGTDLVEKVRSNWGASITYGRSYRLHKRPIGNILQFYIDYTGIDLNVSHYAIGGDGKNVYDSSKQWPSTDEDGNTENHYYIPWNLEKYEGSFGMTLGPSLTVAPFTSLPNQNAHFLKFNIYYHLGYQASVIYMINEKDADVNQTKNSNGYKDMKDNLKMLWGHGLLSTFGFSITWKTIGIGYEYRLAHNKYKSVSPSDFGDSSYKLNTSSNRIFLSLRLGR